MKSILNVENTIQTVIQGEIKELINFNGAPFIKFQLIVTAIEFLGACMDQHEFSKNEESESRFNNAIIKLFPKKYHKYAKKDTEINLFRDLRCGMIHKLCPLTTKIRLTERRHLQENANINSSEIKGDLYLVLEDFYEDLDAACEKLKTRNRKNKLPTKKMEQPYITVEHGTTGNTINNIIKEG
ncbi:MAG TPA: hypothetical protein PK649_04800 [Vicingus sp.]|nr:hypothetical protein [Vicingus sp.]HRP59656.1 hypothetical protein [Vicingus sp.]